MAAGRRPRRVHRWRFRVIAACVKILAPLLDVAVHVEQAEGIGDLQGDGTWETIGVFIVPGVRFEHRGVVERELVAVPRAAGVFPLGFRRQPVAATRSLRWRARDRRLMVPILADTKASAS